MLIAARLRISHTRTVKEINFFGKEEKRRSGGKLSHLLGADKKVGAIPTNQIFGTHGIFLLRDVNERKFKENLITLI